MHDVVVVALGSPLLVGIYEEGRLIETVREEAQTSEALPGIFESLDARYTFSRLIYAKGPGSFMSIKIAYLFLKTLSIVKKIPLLATDAFYFNANRPIKAVGKLCFVKNADTISTERFDEAPAGGFELPQRLRLDDFDADALPFYGIDAVG